MRRNLVLVHTPGLQALEDFLDIRKRMAVMAPDITVMIADTLRRDRAFADLAGGRPSLIVSPTPLGAFKPRRGRIYHGRAIGKEAQLERLAALGIPTPLTTDLAPGISLDPGAWGSHVLLKPTGPGSSHGTGFPIVPTVEINARGPEYYVRKYLDTLGPFMVQQFVATGASARHFRVNTLFGRPLYCLLYISTETLPDLETITEDRLSAAVATNSPDPRRRTFELVADKDVLELAARCDKAFPDVPVKGVDIVRDRKTGQLYVLELNCIGTTWHISSDFFEKYRSGPLTRATMVAQFGAWDVAAAVLAERTRWEAL
ncbi:MAG: hypothetical protein AB7S92_12020 [Parvibaculaceae bacterium]